MRFAGGNLIATGTLTGNANTLTNPITAAQAPNYSIGASDYVVLMNGNLTATLPTAVGIPGRRYLIKTVSRTR